MLVVLLFLLEFNKELHLFIEDHYLESKLLVVLLCLSFSIKGLIDGSESLDDPFGGLEALDLLHCGLDFLFNSGDFINFIVLIQLFNEFIKRSTGIRRFVVFR